MPARRVLPSRGNETELSPERARATPSTRVPGVRAGSHSWHRMHCSSRMNTITSSSLLTSFSCVSCVTFGSIRNLPIVASNLRRSKEDPLPVKVRRSGPRRSAGVWAFGSSVGDARARKRRWPDFRFLQSSSCSYVLLPIAYTTKNVCENRRRAARC